METQAPGTGASPSSQPVHPIHQETATHEAQFVKNNPDNDPHAGTDLEAPQTSEAPEPQQEAKPEESAEESQLELDEEAPIFEMPDLEDPKKTVKVSLKELREQRMMKSDYHRNIQRVKQQESELSAKEKQASLKAAEEYVHRLEVHKLAVQKLAGVRSMQEIEQLAETDPAGAQKEFLRLINVNQQLQSIESEQRQATEKLQAEQQAAQQAAILKSRQTLESDIPGWGEDMYRKVVSAVVKDYGFENKDVEQVYDARLIKVLHDAYQFRQLQRAKPEVNKKVVSVPKVLKPGSAEKTNTSNAADEAAQRLKKSGRGEDFVAWYQTQQKQQKRK
jgi:hypothetical protein